MVTGKKSTRVVRHNIVESDVEMIKDSQLFGRTSIPKPSRISSQIVLLSTVVSLSLTII